MKGTNGEQSGLEKVFIEFIGHTKSQNTETASQINNLATKMGNLAESMARSEERHITNDEGMKKLGLWCDKTDLRVNDIEKQVLLLDKSDDESKERRKTIISLTGKFAVGVSIVIVLAWLGFGDRPQEKKQTAAKKSPVAASVNYD